ncbi:hypothetical protein [Enterococcus gilvus]|uniref:hypothetical protein n=1 Tax=Enterococcus gilvus TaxID=160453 RepID=UPI001C8CB046|nr:hypothetical protein [Enterococcus gilvus]MBX8938503.1 hypothetical protein [Enterococcus gilvus]
MVHIIRILDAINSDITTIAFSNSEKKKAISTWIKIIDDVEKETGVEGIVTNTETGSRVNFEGKEYIFDSVPSGTELVN